MKVTYDWILSHLDTQATPQEMAQALTFSGTETTAMETSWAQNFQLVKICAVEKHPNADQLSLCHLEGFPEDHIIVCGAKNVRLGMITVLAQPGCLLPGQTAPLSTAVLRGVKSHGMLCSSEELGLNSLFGSADGILDLTDDPSFQEFAKTSKNHTCSLQNFLNHICLLDLEITPNRSDLFSVKGVAQELSALQLGTLKSWRHPIGTTSQTTPSLKVSIEKDAQKACRQFYLAHASECLLSEEKSLFFKKRLQKIGFKSIHPAVDLANWITHDLGQPLHIFDADTLRGDPILCLSKGGENFEALDDKSYTLPAGILMLCDEEGPISLPGLIGGKRTACQEKTRSFYIEVAEFSPEIIAKGGQKLNLLSEARTRFERGIDFEIVESIAHFAGSFFSASAQVHAYAKSLQSRTCIVWDPHLLPLLSGVQLSDAEVESRLRRLRCDLIKDSSLTVLSPSDRHDLRRGEDIVEEVLRLKGYEEIEATCFPLQSACNLPQKEQKIQNIRQFLVDRGFFEAVSFSFISFEKAKLFAGELTLEQVEGLRLANPISAELSTLRPSPLPSLLDLASYHKNHQVPFQPVFDIGPRFFGPLPGQQEEVVSGLIPLQASSDFWQKSEDISFYESKGLVQLLLNSLSNGKNFQGSTDFIAPYYHPGRSISFLNDEKQVVATVGQLHPQAYPGAHKLMPLWMFEIWMDRVPLYSTQREFYQAPHLQAVRKDLSFSVPESINVEAWIRGLKQDQTQNLADLVLVDVFQDEVLKKECRKALALRAFFQPKEKSYSDQDLHDLMDKLIQLASQNQGILRGEWS
jgi:phenylalanyl-tRNA synthetase beta chain